LEGGAEARVP